MSNIDTSTRPEIDFPDGNPPADLEKTDIVEGTGPVVEAGDVIAVDYVGVSFSTGDEFDASWNRGQALQFTAGAGQVIEGWDKGLLGMKVGGRRKLVIPPHQAYGDRSPSPLIKAGETLIFVCDLRAIQGK
ncbi:FKBP-type peptidyl-prolyl cis-trans isomerase [Yinghuangia aomiensis]|uniref:Peptidyl-prolyl cis-trans isomerase n=1 Tax=Yinghuangia aomiensis TaxID=676205 RepID=A0ABP9HSV0_9ACTN